MIALSMRGKKTSSIDAIKIITKILEKNNIQEISYGIIVFVKNRKDHKVSVKIQELSGALLITATSKRYKQEIRIYGDETKESITKILQEELGENFRILLT